MKLQGSELISEDNCLRDWTIIIYYILAVTSWPTKFHILHFLREFIVNSLILTILGILI